MKIAIVSTLVPNVLKTGSEIATLALVETLQALGHTVTLYGYGRRFLPVAAPIPAVLLATIPITTAETPLAHKLRWLGRSLRSGLPISSEKYNYVPPGDIAAMILRSGADLLIADHVNLFPFVRALAPRLPVGVVFHDIQALSYAMVAAEAERPWWRAIYRREARLNDRLERAAAGTAAFAWFLSDADAATARARYGVADTRVVPLFYPFDRAAAAVGPDRFDIGLIGTWSWPPVAAGMRWFLDHVLPLLPDAVSVAVAGHGSDGLPAGRLRRLGIVPDARAFLAGCRVAAVPSTAGTGLQIKTLELAALGMPAVSTPLGVRGLDDLPPTLRVADDAPAFAAALLHVLAEREAAGRFGPDPAPAWNAARRAAAEAVIGASLARAESQMRRHGSGRPEAGVGVVPAGQRTAEQP